MTGYSVLMSVYAREKPEYFRAAIQSMIDQTLKADDFVIVCDGPLTDALESVIEWAQNALKEKLNIIRLPVNGGLGKALNEGLRHVKNEFIARMDTDDVSLPDRCERQMEAFLKHPEVSVIGGIVEEFSDDINVVTARRVPPCQHEEILKFAKKRNPFNHPCVMFKKSAVERAGGYQDIYLLEDYYLWIRMLLNGERGMNLQIPLLRMRAGYNMYKRRGGGKYILSQVKLFSYMQKKGMITRGQFMKSVITRSLSSVAPGCVRQFLFMKLMRK